MSVGVMMFIKNIQVYYEKNTGTPKDKDEVNRREVCECDG